MGLSDEIRDPWALLLAAVAGGVAWAVNLPVSAALGVGASVLGVKAFIGSVLDRDSSLGSRVLPVRGRSPEQQWLSRAERAVRSFHDLTGSLRPGPVAQKVSTIAEQVRTTLDAIRRLAGQTSSVGTALERIDTDALAAEESRLRARLRARGGDEVRDEQERALDAVRSQLEVHGRLADAARTLLARMESGTIGLEALVARVAEVLALSETAGGDHGLHRVDELADELEGLRKGLAETEEMSRRALTAYRRGSRRAEEEA